MRCEGGVEYLSKTVSVVEVPDRQRSIAESRQQSAVRRVEGHCSQFELDVLRRVVGIKLHHLLTGYHVPDAHQCALVRRHHLPSRDQTVQTSAKASNIDQTLSGIRIPTSGLIRIRIRMSPGLLPKCCGHQSLRRVS